MSRPLFTKIGTISFKQGERVSLDGGLPRNNNFSALMLRLEANITIVTAVTTAYTEAFWKLLKRIEITANGQNTIKSADGPAWGRMNNYLKGNVPNYSAVPTAVAANQLFNASLFIDFSAFGMVNPVETIFPVAGLKSLDLAVTWGTPSDLYSANPANATINSTTKLVVYGLEEEEPVKPLFLNKFYLLEKELTATSTEFKIQIPAANYFRGFLINADVDGNPSDAVVNTLWLKDGNKKIYRMGDWKHFLDWEKFQKDNESIPVGWAWVDMCPDGLLTQALNSAGMNDLHLLFDAVKSGTTTKIRVYPVELIPAA